MLSARCLIPGRGYCSGTLFCVLCAMYYNGRGVPVRLALEEKDEFKLTKQKLLSAITDKTKMVVLPFSKQPDRCDYDARGITDCCGCN